MAARMCGQEVVYWYLRAMLQGLGAEQLATTLVCEDHPACIQSAHNPVNRTFSRHINTRCCYVRDLVKGRVVDLVKCAGTSNEADASSKSRPVLALCGRSIARTSWGTAREYLNCCHGSPLASRWQGTPDRWSWLRVPLQ